MTHPTCWFALLTRSNFEKKVAHQVARKKIEVFLPKTRKISRRKDRRQVIDVPLFPGYLFVRSSFDPSHQLAILKTPGAVRLLGNGHGPAPVPDTQIDALKIMTAADTELITGFCPLLEKGDPVLVIEGPLAGVTGEFFSHRGRGRVIIQIPVLGRYAGVEIDADQVEKIPGPLP